MKMSGLIANPGLFTQHGFGRLWVSVYDERKFVLIVKEK
jgi:hypothetical protein